MRWWDGAQWTAHTMPPPSTRPRVPAAAIVAAVLCALAALWIPVLGVIAAAIGIFAMVRGEAGIGALFLAAGIVLGLIGFAQAASVLGH